MRLLDMCAQLSEAAPNQGGMKSSAAAEASEPFCLFEYRHIQPDVTLQESAHSVSVPRDTSHFIC